MTWHVNQFQELPESDVQVQVVRMGAKVSRVSEKKCKEFVPDESQG
jgi:hypothetical protein